MNKDQSKLSLRNDCQNSDEAYAAIDLGTNNCRLLIAVPDNDKIRPIDSFSRIVRLGENLGNSGKLSEKAIDRTIKALSICRILMDRNGVKQYRAITTEACRRANNTLAFIDRAYTETGIKMQTITSEQEAALTFAGCWRLLDNHVPYGLVFDIGGGSTELMWIDQQKPFNKMLRAVHSIPEGVVTLFERFGNSILDDTTFENLILHIDTWLQKFEKELGITSIVNQNHLAMLGTSGTMTTIGAMHLGLKRYTRSHVDGMVIDRDSIKALNTLLSSMSYKSRANHPCIGPERADLVIMGCIILEAICRRWPVDQIRIADRGIREGILIGMMQEDGHFSSSVSNRNLMEPTIAKNRISFAS